MARNQTVNSKKPYSNRRQSAGYHDVRYPDGSLAFRIDHNRMIVEIQRRGMRHYFDLKRVCAQPLDKSP